MPQDELLYAPIKTKKSLAFKIASLFRAIGKISMYALLLALVSGSVVLTHIFDEGKAFSEEISLRAYESGYNLYQAEVDGQSFPVFSESEPRSELPVTGTTFDSESSAPKSLFDAEEQATQHLLSLDNVAARPLYEAPARNFNIYGIHMVFESTEHYYTADEYRDGLSCVPAGILELLGAKGWSIHVTNRKIEDVFPFISATKDIEDVSGVCLIFQKEIWIHVDMTPHGLIHELGHAVDWELGGASITPEWSEAVSEVNRIVEKNDWDAEFYEELSFSEMEKFNLCRGIVSRAPFFEQYANAWTRYWTAPNMMLMECPEMFKYFAGQFGIYRLGQNRSADLTVEKALDLSPEFAVQENIDSMIEEGIARRENPLVNVSVSDKLIADDGNGTTGIRRAMEIITDQMRNS